MQKTYPVFIASLTALSVMGLGCNPFAGVQEKINQKIGESVVEKMIEAGSGGKLDVDAKDGGVTFTDPKTGESIGLGLGAKLPADFPSDIPRYGGGMVSFVSLSPDKKRAVIAETIVGPDTEELSAWYDAELKKMGYERTTETNTMSFGEYKKGDVEFTIVIGGQRTDDGKYANSVQIHREEK